MTEGLVAWPEGGGCQDDGDCNIKRCQAQSAQSAGPVRFLIFCSISTQSPLLASLGEGRRPQCSAGVD
jgi:hypothetical protein